MKFTGREDHSITLKDAKALIEAYRSRHPDEVRAHYFGKEIIANILNQRDCVGIRIHYGVDERGAKQLVVTGVTPDGHDLFEGVLGEKSWPCPPYCGSGL